jgi:hypothetical protein
LIQPHRTVIERSQNAAHFRVAFMHTQRRQFRTIVQIVVSTVFSAASLAGAPVVDAHVRFGNDRAFVDGFSRPRVLADHVANYLVRIRGGAICTGTPIAGGTLVVTAAHCVLEADGDVAASRTVLRDGISYEPAAVLVNPQYHRSPRARLDAAVLVMSSAIPGAAATLADTFPAAGAATVAGFQPLDSDGSLLRGTRHDDRPRPKSASGPLIKIETGVAACVGTVAALEITDAEVTAPCGLIPGASGGGLFVGSHQHPILAGVISTVAHDLSYNGLAPLAAVHELLNYPSTYTYAMGPVPSVTSDLDTRRW